MTGLHQWERKTPAEPMTCAICGVYYASPVGCEPCAGGPKLEEDPKPPWGPSPPRKMRPANSRSFRVER